MECRYFARAASALKSSLHVRGKYLEGHLGTGSWVAFSYVKREMCHTYLLEKGLRTLERKDYRQKQEKKVGEKRRGEGGKGERRGIEHGITGNEIY